MRKLRHGLAVAVPCLSRGDGEWALRGGWVGGWWVWGGQLTLPYLDPAVKLSEAEKIDPTDG